MKNIINQGINSVILVVMTFFAIPKLLGKPQSIEGFKQFENAIHLDADFFRIFTGVSELGLALLFLTINKNTTIGKMAFSFLLITMITALGLEFFARPEPKIILVIIAVILAVVSVYRLKTMKQASKLNHQ